MIDSHTVSLASNENLIPFSCENQVEVKFVTQCDRNRNFIPYLVGIRRKVILLFVGFGWTYFPPSGNWGGIRIWSEILQLSCNWFGIRFLTRFPMCGKVRMFQLVGEKLKFAVNLHSWESLFSQCFVILS